MPSNQSRRRAGRDRTEISRDVVRRLSGLVRARPEGLLDQVVESILQIDQNLYRDAGPAAIEDLRQAGAENLERILQVLGEDIPDGVDPFEVARTVGRRQLQQDLPLEGALQAYRVVGQAIWKHLVGAARSSRSAGDSEALLDGASLVWQAIDQFSAAMAAAYRAEEAVLHGRAAGLQGALLEALIEGRGHDRAFARDAARGLGLPSQGTKLCAVALITQVDDPLPGIQSQLAAAGIQSAWQLRAEGETGLLALGSVPMSRALSLLRANARNPVGVSPPFEEWAEVPRALHFADLAARSALCGQDVSSLDEVLIEALLLDSPLICERIEQRTVGALDGLPPGQKQLLLETLRCYLDNDASVAKTAVAAFCHRNSVTYRLRRIEALSGLGTKSFQDRATWQLGLLARNLRATGMHNAQT